MTELAANPLPVNAEEPTAFTPAVEHALAVGNRWTAAAIHILDGINSPIFPRAAVGMAGIDWDTIDETAPRLSSGEYWLAHAACELDQHQWVTWPTLAEVRQRVDQAGRRRVDEAMLMAGQRIPATVTDYSDPDSDT